ncbi:hypothetical protein EDC04DRAFT_2610428 [Pisolithus marmoratus]|nr:hypothetical protein EDC04DRAFT_2610428 [Pisolithus marmoratus]
MSSGERDLTREGGKGGADEDGKMGDDAGEAGAAGNGAATIVNLLQSYKKTLMGRRIRGGKKLFLVTVMLSDQPILFIGEQEKVHAIPLLCLRDTLEHGVECRREMSKLSAEKVELGLNGTLRGRGRHGTGNRVGRGSLSIERKQEGGFTDRDAVKKPFSWKTILIFAEESLCGRPVPKNCTVDVVIQFNTATDNDVMPITLAKRNNKTWASRAKCPSTNKRWLPHNTVNIVTIKKVETNACLGAGGWMGSSLSHNRHAPGPEPFTKRVKQRLSLVIAGEGEENTASTIRPVAQPPGCSQTRESGRGPETEEEREMKA